MPLNPVVANAPEIECFGMASLWFPMVSYGFLWIPLVAHGAPDDTWPLSTNEIPSWLGSVNSPPHFS